MNKFWRWFNGYSLGAYAARIMVLSLVIVFGGIFLIATLAAILNITP